MLRSVFFYPRNVTSGGYGPRGRASRHCSPEMLTDVALLLHEPPTAAGPLPLAYKALLNPRDRILLTQHLPAPPVGAEAARRWQRGQPPFHTPRHLGKANSDGLQPPTMQPQPRRQRPGTRRDQLFTWPFHLKLLKLSSAQAVFLDELNRREKRYGTTSCTLRKIQIKKLKNKKKEKKGYVHPEERNLFFIFSLIS